MPRQFHASTQTVAVYTTVVDRNRHLITGLTEGDFEVRDDGKPVTLSVFSAEPVPVALAVLLDTSGSMTTNLPLVVNATRELVARLRPDDRMRIGAFGDRTFFSPGFTNDRDELLRFLQTRVRAGGGTPLWNAVDLAMVYLKDERSRRVVIAFTDGFDTETIPAGFDLVRKRAEADSVMVYSIGCWGGPDSGDDKPDDRLRKISDETGGGYAELTWSRATDLASTFSRILDEVHQQYVLGFSPLEHDGKTHSIEVRVKRPGLTVKARRSYVAPPSVLLAPGR